ncbi:MAG: CoA transferase [Chloroflexi bacterium]|nr:CoA transferase [Chloroflexota bacterium]
MTDVELLSGIRVVDWTVFGSAPYASQMLAGLGADVIHVEERERGDLLRQLNPPGGDLHRNGRHVIFEGMNVNKKSLAVDLKHPRGKEIVCRLVERSDAFITNFRRAAVEKLGMTYADLRPRNPRLIYCSTSGFGLRGPDTETPSLDNFAQARAATLTMGREPGDPPSMTIPTAGGRTMGIIAAFGIVSALLGRDRLGISQELHVSILGSLICLQGSNLSTRLLLGGEMDPSRPSGPERGAYRCKDGKWILAGVLGMGRWPRLCEALGRPELATDSRFDDDAKRIENVEELQTILNATFAEKDSRQWVDILKRHDVMVSPVNEVTDLENDPQVTENGYIIDWDHPTMGPVQFPGFPVEFFDTPWRINRPAPQLGEHNEEILTQLCGYSLAEVQSFRAEGVI